MNASVLIDCEDSATLHLVKNILDLFPGKRHLGQPLADLLMHFNERNIDERHRLENELAHLKSNKNRTDTVNDIRTKKQADLEKQVESATL